MTEGDLLSIGRDAVFTAFLVSAPFLIASLLIGVVISVFQAASQIHEQNVIFIPKIVATGLILIFAGSWIISVMISFTENIFTFINHMT